MPLTTFESLHGVLLYYNTRGTVLVSFALACFFWHDTSIFLRLYLSLLPSPQVWTFYLIAPLATVCILLLQRFGIGFYLGGITLSLTIGFSKHVEL